MKFRKLVDYFERLEGTSKRLMMTDILAELFKNINDKDEIDKIIYLCQGQLLPAFENIEFGMSEKLIQKAIAKTSGYPLEKISEMFKKIGDYGQVAEVVGKEKKQILSVSALYKRLQGIVENSGEGAVAKKVGLLADILRDVSPKEAKYVLRIILGRLRLGIGDPTVLDSLSLAYQGDKSLRPKLERAYNLCSDLGLVAEVLFRKGIEQIEDFKVIVGRPIRMALAERLSSPEEIIDKIGKCAVEAKYDGFRCQVHKDKDRVKIFSRNLESTTLMFPELVKGTLEQIKERQVIFEGEAVAYNPNTGEYLPFQFTVQRKRKYDIAQMQKLFPLRIFIFDLLYAGEDLTNKPYQERRRVLSQILKKGQVLEISEVSIVSTSKELSNIFEDAITKGLEGIVAKRLDAAYQAGGRNFNWIKLKRSYSGKLTDTIDCVLVGYFAGKGQRAAFGVGSLLACVYDKKEERFKTIAKIGSGLTEEEWVKIKKILDAVRLKEKPQRVDSLISPDVWVEPKFVVEIQADEITKSPVHTCGKNRKDEPGFALRFPRMVNFIRMDKKPEDATGVDEILEMFNRQGQMKKRLNER